jgi:hypothetical protein
MTAPEPPGPALAARAAELRARGAAAAYYVYWFSASAAGAPHPSPARPRTLVAFPTPDAALAFAQRGVRRDPATPPRLRRLSLLQLLEVVLREPAIAALLLVSEDAPPPPPGTLPTGLTLRRDELLG